MSVPRVHVRVTFLHLRFIVLARLSAVSDCMSQTTLFTATQKDAACGGLSACAKDHGLQAQVCAKSLMPQKVLALRPSTQVRVCKPHSLAQALDSRCVSSASNPAGFRCTTHAQLLHYAHAATASRAKPPSGRRAPQAGTLARGPCAYPVDSVLDCYWLWHTV